MIVNFEKGALQIALLTPFILDLGMPKYLITLVWLCGPIAGLVVQPIVGVWSDRLRTRMGRRKPFIFGGALLIIFSLLLIAFSIDLGKILGDPVHSKTKIGAMALAVININFSLIRVKKIIGFWILDIANNAVHSPTRALVSDIGFSDQQDAAHAFFSVWLGN